MVRIATFNVENLDSDDQGELDARIQVMRPQMERIGADILCLQECHSEEVDGRRQLDGLNQLITGTSYENFNRATTETVGGQLYTVRNIVTLSRFPITNTEIRRDSDGPRPEYQQFTAVPPYEEAEPVEWERPMLYSRIDLGQDRTLHLVNLHMKSKLASSIRGQKEDRYTWRSVSGWAEGYFMASMKRVGQAVQVRLLVDEIFDAEGEQALIAVCGDYNADFGEVPVTAIRGPVEETGNPEHAPRIMIPCEFNIPESARFSHYHLGKGNMLDHVLASRQLFRYFVRTEIHNEALPDESGAFRDDTKFPESDHAPVIAVFEL
jgi:endonuclease/exonuclease/phosphatase family metal-dependent hydrolase